VKCLRLLNDENPFCFLKKMSLISFRTEMLIVIVCSDTLLYGKIESVACINIVCCLIDFLWWMLPR